jgi:hypothetical protein
MKGMMDLLAVRKEKRSFFLSFNPEFPLANAPSLVL